MQGQNPIVKAKVMVQKILTLQEANGLLPLVKEHFFRLNLLIVSLQKAKLEKDLAAHKWIINEKIKSIRLTRNKKNQNNYVFSSKVKKLELKLALEFNILIGFGAMVRSIFPAHIDFLSIKNGQLICLCWNGKDKEISHWHYLNNEHLPKQIIEEKELFGPSVVH